VAKQNNELAGKAVIVFSVLTACMVYIGTGNMWLGIATLSGALTLIFINAID